MYKKGNIFKRYRDQYLFYLEIPYYLKYGKKGKPLSSCLDISMATIQVPSDSQTKFKIICPKSNSLSLKTESGAQRDEWIEEIRGLISKNNRQDIVMEVDATSLDGRGTIGGRQTRPLTIGGGA